MNSPPDRDMGDLQKIMYVHVPSAWSFFIAFFVVLVASVMYLVDARRALRSDRGERRRGRRGAHGARAAHGIDLGALDVGRVVDVGRAAHEHGVLLPDLSSDIFRCGRRSRIRSGARSGAPQWGSSARSTCRSCTCRVRWWRTLHQVQSSPSTVAGSYVVGLRLNALAMLLVTVWFIRRALPGGGDRARGGSAGGSVRRWAGERS